MLGKVARWLVLHWIAAVLLVRDLSGFVGAARIGQSSKKSREKKMSPRDSE
jgi:hypothetical protein